MKDLFLSECRRFRNAALIFGAVHLVVLAFVLRSLDFLQMLWAHHLLLVFLCMLSGVILALYQFGTYRKPSRWLWLLHRPLPRMAIFSGIALASGMLILFAVGLPALLAVLGNDLLSHRTVDLRHYLMVPELVLLTMIAWTVGAYVMLNRSFSAIGIVLVPVVLLAHMASGQVMLPLTLLCLALLVAIVYASFKPDRLAPPSTRAALIATAAPLHLAFYFVLIWAGSLSYQGVLLGLGVHPNFGGAAAGGGYTQARYSSGSRQFLRGLADATDPRTDQWRQQISQQKISKLYIPTPQFPVRHQLSNGHHTSMVDHQRQIYWTFNHDAMRFQGRDLETGEARGWLGTGGIDDRGRFSAVPLSFPGHSITPQTLYTLDAASGSLRPRLQLTAPEALANLSQEFGERRYLITNLRLRVFAAPGNEPTGMLNELFSLALPGPLSDLHRVDIATVPEGTLVSFSYGRRMADGVSGSMQTIMLLDNAGKARLIAQRPLKHDFPLLFEHHAWWVSPVLHAMLALPEVLLAKGYVLDQGKQAFTNQLDLPRPALAWSAAIVAALLSALGAAYWLRASAISARERAGWIASCLLLGPPSLLCLMAIHARRPALR